MYSKFRSESHPNYSRISQRCLIFHENWSCSPIFGFSSCSCSFTPSSRNPPEFPAEIGGLWICIVKFKDHGIRLLLSIESERKTGSKCRNLKPARCWHLNRTIQGFSSHRHFTYSIYPLDPPMWGVGSNPAYVYYGHPVVNGCKLGPQTAKEVAQ